MKSYIQLNPELQNALTQLAHLKNLDISTDGYFSIKEIPQQIDPLIESFLADPEAEIKAYNAQLEKYKKAIEGLSLAIECYWLEGDICNAQYDQSYTQNIVKKKEQIEKSLHEMGLLVAEINKQYLEIIHTAKPTDVCTAIVRIITDYYGLFPKPSSNPHAHKISPKIA